MASVPGPEVILNEGRKLPEGKWVYLAAMVLAVPALALSWYKYNIRVAGLCFVVMLILMTVTKIFVKVGDKQSGVDLKWQIWFFSWFCIALFVVVSLALSSSMLFGIPKINWSFLDPPAAKADTLSTDNQTNPVPLNSATESATTNPTPTKPEPTPQADTGPQSDQDKKENDVIDSDADFDQAAVAQEKQGDEKAFSAIAHMIDGDMVLNGRTRDANNTPEQEQERVRSFFQQARWSFEAADQVWNLALGDSVDSKRKARLEAKLKQGGGITCIQRKTNKAPDSQFTAVVSCRANGTSDHLIHLWDGQEFSIRVSALHNY